MSNLDNISNAPYPFTYPSKKGFIYAGFEHTIEETIETFLDKQSNKYARHILFNEPEGMSSLEIVETVEKYTGKELAIVEVWEKGEEKIEWFRDTYKRLL